jgi:hypothetical protein
MLALDVCCRITLLILTLLYDKISLTVQTPGTAVLYINLYRKLQPGRTVGRGVLYSVSHCGRCEKVGYFPLVHHFLTHTASPGFFSVFTLSLLSSYSSHVFLNFFLHFFPSILSPLCPPNSNFPFLS